MKPFGEMTNLFLLLQIVSVCPETIQVMFFVKSITSRGGGGGGVNFEIFELKPVYFFMIAVADANLPRIKAVLIEIFLNTKNYWKKKKRLCVRLRSGDKHHLRKTADRKAQIRKAFGNAFRSPD